MVHLYLIGRQKVFGLNLGEVLTVRLRRNQSGMTLLLLILELDVSRAFRQSLGLKLAISEIFGALTPG